MLVYFDSDSDCLCQYIVLTASAGLPSRALITFAARSISVNMLAISAVTTSGLLVAPAFNGRSVVDSAASAPRASSLMALSGEDAKGLYAVGFNVRHSVRRHWPAWPAGSAHAAEAGRSWPKPGAA